MIHESFLKRIQRTVGKACRRLNRLAFHGFCQNKTGQYGSAINDDSARSTATLSASVFWCQIADTTAQDLQ
jgi:hypothetical protein